MGKACLFCRIARGEVETHEIYRDDHILAFLDIGPIREGHVQIIPLAHHATFDVLPAKLMNRITALGQRIAGVQKTLFGVTRVGFLFTGGDIAHAHAHLVPMHEKYDITSQAYFEERNLTYRPVTHPGEDALAQTAARLAASLRDAQRV